MEKHINFKLPSTNNRMDGIYTLHIYISRECWWESGWQCYFFIVCLMRVWEGVVSPSFRAWNGNTFTQKQTNKQTQTFWRTYCHVHNFKFDTTLQVICFVHFLSHSVHNNFIFCSRVCVRVCTRVSGGEEWSILCVHLFCLCLYTVSILHSSAMSWHATQECCGCARVCDSNRRRHIMRFYIHIFCKTNENILMSSLNIT